MPVFEGNLVAPQAKVAIIISRFNGFINERLLEGAIDALVRVGQLNKENIDVFRVPGAFEQPLVARRIAETEKYKGIIALGSVIRGDTPHFDYVANGASSGLSQVMLNNNIPISFGLLTTDNVEQAIDRAGVKAGNKGFDAAITLLEMINLLEKI